MPPPEQILERWELADQIIGSTVLSAEPYQGRRDELLPPPRLSVVDMNVLIDELDTKWPRVPLNILSRLRIVDVAGCWAGEGFYRDKDGYTFMYDPETKRTNMLLHRFMYRSWHDEIDPWLEIDHLCCNAWCCWPRHLEQVTSEENKRRRRVDQYKPKNQGRLWTPTQ